MFKRISIKAVTAGTAAVLGLVAAGCGSSQGVGGAGDGPAPQAPAVVTPKAVVPADVTPVDEDPAAGGPANGPAGAPAAAGPGTEAVSCYGADGSVAGVVELDRPHPGVPLTGAEKESLCARRGWSATR